ncbi:MAG: ankyrin repeat domain-containing protein [Gemmatimonadota bacterium]|nr:MAG: ankyrin repeat domain-containing protein [Gemmatimonadota bacterium]
MHAIRSPSLLLAFTAIFSAAHAQDIREAARAGDAAAVAALLEGNADLVNSTDDHDRTPLHYAAGAGATEVAQLLLAHGAAIDARAHSGETPLTYAALRSHPAVVELLLARGADTEIRDDYGRTPLLLVARETGNVEVATILLDGGAEVNGRDRYNATPLELAAWRGHGALVDLLLDRGAEVPASGPDADFLATLAIEQGLERLFTLLADAVDLDTRNESDGSLLHSASEGGSARIVGILLDRGLDVDERDRYGRAPLHYSAEYGHREVVELLIERGATLDARSVAGYSALNMAQAGGHDRVVELLAAQGASTAPVDFPVLQGPYMGQPRPGREPVPFALDIVASHRFEHCVPTFAPDGEEAFWSSSFIIDESGYTRSILFTSRLEGDRWTEPTRVPFSQFTTGDGEPIFDPGGERLFFLSYRPSPVDSSRAERIWYVDRTGDGWSEPHMIEGGPNALEMHWQFSVAANGNIYFGSGAPGGLGEGDVYVSRFVDGRWREPENLGPMINTEAGEGSPFIAPDESYLIFTGNRRPGGVGGVDLYISFRDDAGNWTAPRNMGEPVNSRGYEVCALVTPDGAQLILNSSRRGNDDAYWVDAAVIDELRGR